jgi:hypothetical protein
MCGPGVVSKRWAGLLKFIPVCHTKLKVQLEVLIPRRLPKALTRLRAHTVTVHRLADTQENPQNDDATGDAR